MRCEKANEVNSLKSPTASPGFPRIKGGQGILIGCKMVGDGGSSWFAIDLSCFCESE